ncbi:hypothetical protein OFB79_24335, partial [Escherichia coli]|nr:hypothetical protein [Escherichia coli]
MIDSPSKTTSPFLCNLTRPFLITIPFLTLTPAMFLYFRPLILIANTCATSASPSTLNEIVGAKLSLSTWRTS